MASSGTDFICKNENCKNNKCGIIITAPWPLGDIDAIINEEYAKKNADFQMGLINLKNQGRKYACIRFPNKENISIVGYRVNMWCEKCPCLWTYDAIINDPSETMQDTIEKANIPDSCVTCGNKLLDYMEVLEKGIVCPSCKNDLIKSTWFSNDKE